MQQTPTNPKIPIIVIGTGSVGVKFVNELLFRQPGACVKIFGGEEQRPYSRENLSKLLAGNLSNESLYSRNKLHESKNIVTFYNNPIVSIDAKKREVTDSLGDRHRYKELVFAVGSSPKLINIENTHLQNVFTFRNINDAELLKTRQIGSRRTVVIGGGMVGLDTAYAMNQHNTKVTVIENSTRLMSQLLDDHASVYLRLFLDDLGIDVRNESNVARIEGDSKVEQVVLEDGEIIPCDTVIISIGIDPNIDLAKSIKLNVNRGIVINNHLQTSHKNIYAIGECAEHRGRIYAIVQPGFEQASVLAKIISGGKAKYTGTITTSALGVVEYPIISIGDNGDSEGSNEVKYRDIKRMVYRKIVLKHGRLHGVIAAGPWKQSETLSEMVEKKQYIWPNQRKQFEKTGQL